MQYLFKNNKLYKYNENIIVESEYDTQDKEFCVEENGFKLLSALNGKTFEIQKGLVVVDNNAKLKTIESKLPNLDTNFTNEFVVSTKQLNEAKDYTDKRNIKPILTGVYVNENGTIVATDSYKVYCINKGSSGNGVVLSIDFINEIAKETKEALIKFNSTCACIELEDRKIYGRLLTGSYPNVLGIIDKCKASASVMEEVLTTTITDKIKVGELVGGDIDIVFTDDKVVFNGDNEYQAENDTPIKNIMFKLDMIKLAFKYVYNPKIYYSGDKAPLLLCELNKVIVALPIKK